MRSRFLGFVICGLMLVACGARPTSSVYAPDVGAPELLSEIHPQYPPDARDAGIEGSVELAATVLPDGSVADVAVTQSLDPDGLDREAVAAVGQWRFTPGTRLGKAVPVRVAIEVQFRLGEPTRTAFVSEQPAATLLDREFRVGTPIPGRTRQLGTKTWRVGPDRSE